MTLEPRTLEEAVLFARSCSNCYAKFGDHTRHPNKSDRYWCPRIEGRIIEWDPISGRGMLITNVAQVRLRFTLHRHWIQPGSSVLFAPCWRLERAYRLRKPCRGGGSR